MAIYIITTLTSVLLSWTAAKNQMIQHEERPSAISYSRLSYGLFAFLSFLPLFFVSAFRYNITKDYYYTYVPGYYKIANGQGTHFEPAFVLLNKIVYYVFNDVNWIFIITSFLFLALIFHVIYHRSADIPMSIFLLVGARMYYTSFGQIRQYIVIAVFLYALKYMEEDRFLKYVLIIVASALVHKLALVYLPIYFLCRIKLSRKAYLVTSLSFFAAMPMLQIVYHFFARAFYINYIDAGYRTTGYSEVMIAMTLMTYLLIIVYYYRIPQTRYNTILINLHLAAAVLSVTTIGIWESYRLLALFMYPSILLILPQIIHSEQNKYVRALLSGFIISIFSYEAIQYLLYSDMIPYQTIFSH